MICVERIILLSAWFYPGTLFFMIIWQSNEERLRGYYGNEKTKNVILLKKLKGVILNNLIELDMLLK